MSDKQSTTDDWRSSAKNKRTRSLIASQLLQLFEIHNDTSVAVHLLHILRSRGASYTEDSNGIPKRRDLFHIKDEEFLKDLENYKAELEEKITEDDE